MMAIYLKHLKKHRALICALIVILLFQAVFALTVPYLTGELIGIGVQQKGIDTSGPEMLTEKAMDIFSMALPENEYKSFCSAYEKQGELYIVSDEDKASELYRNGVMSGFYIALDMAEGNLGSVDNTSVESMMNIATVDLLYALLKEIDEPTADVRLSAYSKALEAPESLKGQLAGVALPYFYSDAGVSVESVQKTYLLKQGSLMAALVLLQTFCFMSAGRLSAKISSSVERDIRNEIINHTAKLTRRQRRGIKTSLYTLFSSDVSNIGTITDFILSAVLYAPFVTFGGIVFSFSISSSLSLTVFVAAVAAIGMVFVIYKKTLPAYDRLQSFYGFLVRSAKTAVNQLYTVRTMQTRDFERNRFLSVADKVRKNERFVLRSVFTALSLVTLLSNIIMAVAVGLSGKSLLRADLGTGDIVAFLQYSVLTVSAFTTLAGAILFAPRARSAFDALSEVMSVSPDNERLLSGIELKEEIDTVEFRKVTAMGITAQVSFAVKRGELIAITGPTGCGKTTLLSLLCDDSEKESGEVLVNSLPIEKISLRIMRDRVSFAQAEPILFSKSVRENMLLYGACDEKSMDEALKGAEVDFIDNKDMILYNGGARLSGGQRNRLALAAALSKRADIYIADDCLRAVDSVTEEKILTYLRKLSEKSIVIIVTNRINSLMASDRVVVLSEDGTVAEGTHGELLEKSDFYRDLICLQKKEVELYE